jgi:hypothetical protein
MYVVRYEDKEWFVGFRYSDGRIDRVASFKTEIDARTSATRLNNSSSK